MSKKRTPQRGRRRPGSHAAAGESRRRVRPRRVETRRRPTRKTPPETSRRVAQVLAAMRRDGLSLTRALRGAGVSRRTVERLAGSALRKQPNGRYVARATDRLARVVSIPTPDGVRAIVLRTFRDASRLGEYWNAVHAYLATGDTAGLTRFEGVVLTTTDGERVPLLTDRAVLDHLGYAGVLSFESLYAKGA